MSERFEYLVAVLDLYLMKGLTPRDAWDKTLDSYAYVYHNMAMSRAVAGAKGVPKRNGVGSSSNYKAVLGAVVELLASHSEDELRRWVTQLK